jgi:hypothetical protein
MDIVTLKEAQQATDWAEEFIELITENLGQK